MSAPIPPVTNGQAKRTLLSERERAQLKYVENLSGIRDAFWSRLINGQGGSCDLRELWSACGYGDIDNIDPQWYRTLYDTFSIANRICRLMPAETWQAPPSVYEDEDADTITDFEEAWDNLPKGLASGGQTWNLANEEGSCIWTYLEDLDVLSGIGSFGVMLFGFDDGKNLQDPVDGIQVLDPNKDSSNGAAKKKPMPDTPFKSMKGGKVTEEQKLLNEDQEKGLIEPDMNYANPDAACNQVRNKVSAKDQYPNVPQNPARTDPRTTQSFESQNHPNVQGRNPTSAGTGQPPPNQGYSDGTVGSPGAGPFVQGTDQQYERTSGMGMAFPAGAALSGTDQQYFGVQFGPSEEFGPPAKQQRRLLFLRVFDESLVQVVRYEWNIRNPRFGLPVMYRITLNDPRTPHGGVGLPLATVYVHWSRVLHIPSGGSPVPSPIFGIPLMKPNLEHLLPLRKIYAADGQGYWKNAFSKLVLSTHPQLGGDVDIEAQGGKAQLQEDVDLFNDPMTNQALMLVGMQATTLPPSVTDPTPHCEVHLKAIALQMDVPYPVFQGYEIGEQASENNQDIWNNRKRGRQLKRNTFILVSFIDRLIAVGVLPAPQKQKKEMKQDGKTITGDKDFVQKPLRPPGSQQPAAPGGAAGGGGGEGKPGGFTGPKGNWQAEEAAGGQMKRDQEQAPTKPQPTANANPDGINQYTRAARDADISSESAKSLDKTGTAKQRKEAHMGAAKAHHTAAIRAEEADMHALAVEHKSVARGHLHAAGFFHDPTLNRRTKRVGKMIYACNAEGEIKQDEKGKPEVAGVVTEAGYSIEWPDVDALSKKDQAAVCLQQVQADAAYIAGGNDQLIHPRDYLTRYKNFTEEEAEAILQTTIEAQQEQQEQADQLAEEQGFEPIPPEGYQSPEAQIEPHVVVGPGETLHHADDIKPGKALKGQKAVPGQVMPGGGGGPPFGGPPGAGGGKGGGFPGKKPTMNELVENAQPRDAQGRWIEFESVTRDTVHPGDVVVVGEKHLPVFGISSRRSEKYLEFYDESGQGDLHLKEGHTIRRWKHPENNSWERVPTEQGRDTARLLTQMGFPHGSSELEQARMAGIAADHADDQGLEHVASKLRRFHVERGGSLKTNAGVTAEELRDSLGRWAHNPEHPLTNDQMTSALVHADMADDLGDHHVSSAASKVREAIHAHSQGEHTRVTKFHAMHEIRFEHATLKNRDGTPLRVTASGACKTWKTRPNEFRLPVKHGLYDSTYITHQNADEWRPARTRQTIGASALYGLRQAVQHYIWRRENGRTDNTLRSHHAVKADLIVAGDELAKHPLCMPGYGSIDVKNDGSGEVWWTGGDSDGEGFDEVVRRRLMAIDGITKVYYFVEIPPPREGGNLTGAGADSGYSSGSPIWDEVWVASGREYQGSSTLPTLAELGGNEVVERP